MERSATRRMTAAGPLALIVVSAIAGCSHKSAQCQSLIGAVNGGTARLSSCEAERQKRSSGSAAQTAQDMRRLAAVYDENARALDPAQLSEQELSFRAREYAQTSKNAADAAGTLASALDNQEHARAGEAEVLLERAVRDQKATIARINELCAR